MTRHAIRCFYAAPALAIALLSRSAPAAPRSPSVAVPDAPELRPYIIDAGGLRSVLAIEQRAKHGAIERRQGYPAVDFCARIQTRLDGNRAVVEGLVAHGSRAVVRNLRGWLKGAS